MVKTIMIEYRLNGPASQSRQRIRLMAALRENRFPQAILIDGPVGIGKKALAMEIAKALQCSDDSVRPCGQCFDCKMASDVGNTDNWVIPLESKEAHARSASGVSATSNAKTIQDFKQTYIESIVKNPYRIDIFSASAEISVGLIRNMTASFALKGDRVRTIIVAEADRMNDSAANAFLKTLEEVPPNTYFILTTSSRERLLQTIRSRCLALHLLPLTDEEVRNIAIDFSFDDFDESAVTNDVVGLAVGSPGKAIYYAQHAASWLSLASDFVNKSLAADYTDLFFKLEDADIEDAATANRFLEILSFLLADMARSIAGSPLRIADTTNCVDTSRYPLVNLSAIEIALADVQEMMSRISSRRTSAKVCLQSLSIKLFEGAK